LKNGNVEKWKFGKMESWKSGNLERWKFGKIGNLEKWKFGKMKIRRNAIWKNGTSEKVLEDGNLGK